MHENLIAAPYSINTDNGVQEEERQKVLVIMQSNALIDPYTVMIRFLDTETAHRTMFAPCWLLNQTSSALITALRIDHTVLLKTSNGMEHVSFVSLL